jgi:FAD:protein FMN transferase
MMDPATLPAAHQFKHDAMNTTFSLQIVEPSFASARGMAQACFEQLDFIEARLSRYVPDSDVARINQMAAGETLYISEICHQCLLLALDAQLRTAGLFDITLGRLIEHRKNAAVTPPPSLSGNLTISPTVPAITCAAAGREIDLGGIGKGFALDQLQNLLQEWGASAALLSAGASSQLAFGAAIWPIALADSAQRISLQNRALSVSGTTLQGDHIVHPAGDKAMPANRCERIWVTADSAALAEIWSTTLMLLDPKDISEFIADDATLHSVHFQYQGEVRSC